MNRYSFLLYLLLGGLLLQSCGMMKPRYGCPSNGTNVGAEKLLSEPPKKVKKFRA